MDDVVPGAGYMTPERVMIRDMARQFAREEVTPIANKLDPVQGDIPRDLIRKMGELGFFGILIPQEQGGLGLGAFEKPKGELPNNVTGSPIPKIGYFGWKTWELRFEETRAPVQKDTALNDGRAFQAAAAMLGIARAHTAARSIGLAQAALDHAV